MSKRRFKAPVDAPLFAMGAPVDPDSVAADGSGPRIESGSTGGPATAQGVGYQLKIALYETLELIARQLAAPYKDLSIGMEPRQVDEGGVTRWDLGLGLPSRLLEVKLNASRGDVTDWLDRIRQTSSGDVEFRLVYAGGAAKVILSVTRLIRLAKEAGSEREFVELWQREQIRDAEFILQHLGMRALPLLRRMKMHQSAEETVERDIRWRADSLCPTQHERESLILNAEHRLFEAMQNRTRVSIRQLIGECQAKGLNLIAPPTIVTQELAPPVRTALGFLRHCRDGVATDVLAEVMACEVEEVPRILEQLVKDRGISAENGFWRLSGVFPSIPEAEERNAVERGLRALLQHIDAGGTTLDGHSPVADAVRIASVCKKLNPVTVLGTFRALEKHLKRLGNKHLVLELATLTIGASHGPHRDTEAVRAEAQALICGRSWALQRLDDLGQAADAAEKSLVLGKAVGWDRNTAFCLKCNGRLSRLRAERLTDKTTRLKLLDVSISMLAEAIDTFSHMTEIGPDDPEVGDCFSLVARTYLVAKQHEKARIALQEAYKRIPAGSSKHYLDLLILTADLEAEVGNRTLAERYYDDALARPQDGDAQVSEIFARGYLQRGLNRSALGLSSAALQDYERARTIWSRLGEDELAAYAHWEAIKTRDRGGLASHDNAVLRIFEESYSYLVRVTAYEHYRKQRETPSADLVANRKAPSDLMLRQILKSAKAEVAVKYYSHNE